MSNQVHPFLLHRDPCEEGVFNACGKSNEKEGRKSEASHKAQTSTYTNRKIEKKRKSLSKSKIAKKMKFEASEFAGSDGEDSGNDGKPESKLRRSVRVPKSQSRPVKGLQHQDEILDSISENAQDDIISYRGPLKSARPLKQGAKKVLKATKGLWSCEAMDSYSTDDDSPDDIYHQHGMRSCNRKLKTGLKTTRKVKPQLIEIVDSGSESPLSDESENEDDRKIVRSPGSSQRRAPFHKELESDSEEYYDMRKGVSRPTQKRETKPVMTRQASISKGKNAARPSPGRRGPKMRLPVTRVPAMKGPAKKSLSFSTADAKVDEEDAEFKCDIESCSMTFASKQDLAIHKQDISLVKGCGKKFFSHKYLVQHHRVHMDDRPLKCPWKGCRMTFKWAWARTEHIRVHTGTRPYVCNEPDCGQTFRFVSDFCRHKCKTGHSEKKTKK